MARARLQNQRHAYLTERGRSRGATHVYSGEQTPLSLSSKAILSRCLRMARFIPLILTAGVLTGCTTGPHTSAPQPSPQPQRSERAKHSFSVGMTRKEVRAELAGSWLLVSASRPPTGWSSQDSPPAGGRAAMVERSLPGAVSACDVFWVGHTNAPKMYFGKRLDYFYFDRDEKLIRFDWWILD
jgi:hypothetical protein